MGASQSGNGMCKCFGSDSIKEALKKSSLNVKAQIERRKSYPSKMMESSEDTLHLNQSNTSPGFLRANTVSVSAADKSSKKITVNDFRLVKVLGKGSFGKVCLVEHHVTKELLAMKKIRKVDIEEKGQFENILTERLVLCQNTHPFIIKLKYAFQTDEKIYLVMEYMPGGELFFHLRRRRKFTEDAACFYAAEVVCALDYLHSELNITYRDLKPENILLDSEGHIKLTDFGLSKNFKQKNYSLCGTPEYLAPEVLRGDGAGKEVDWWSLGCFLFEILVGEPPFKNKNRNKLYKIILENKPQFPAWMSDKAIDLIKNLLTINPANRLGAKSVDEIKNHPFFAHINWDHVASRRLNPPIVPEIRNATDVRNFEREYTTEMPRDTPVIPAKKVHYPDFSYYGNMLPSDPSDADMTAPEGGETSAELPPQRRPTAGNDNREKEIPY